MAGSGLMSNKGPALPHLSKNEIADLRDDVNTTLAPMAAITVEEFTNPAAASTNAILLAKASTIATQSYAAAALDGAKGAGVMSPPRNITVTTAGVTPADAPATATITGVDVNGAVISESISVPQAATTAVGNKAFAKVTSIALTAGDGTNATVAVGFGSKVGLSKKIKSRAGAAVLVREVVDGALVTTGTMADAATGLPNGTYSPATAPDGAHDYAIYYEYDPTA